MKRKKTKKADLEKKRNLFLEIGFVFILAATLIAFEWKSTEGPDGDLGNLLVDVDYEEEMINTYVKDKPKPEPPPKAHEEIEIVKDDKKIKDELKMENTETDENMAVAIEPMSPEEPEEEEVFQFFQLEEKPTFPGGNGELLKYLAKNTKYPKIAIENGASGRVYVGFIIDKNGNVTNVKIMREVDPFLEEEAMRVVKSMPKWKPGKQRGKKVSVQYQVPIDFILKQ